MDMFYHGTTQRKKTNFFRRKEWRFMSPNLKIICFSMLLLLPLSCQTTDTNNNKNVEKHVKDLDKVNSVDLRKSSNIIEIENLNVVRTKCNLRNCHNNPSSDRLEPLQVKNLLQNEPSKSNEKSSNIQYYVSDIRSNIRKNVEGNEKYFNSEQEPLQSTSNSDGVLKTLYDDFVYTLDVISAKANKMFNKTSEELEDELYNIVDDTLSKNYYKIIDGIEIQRMNESNQERKSKDWNLAPVSQRALFNKFSYEYRLYSKIRNFVQNHIVSINLPKAARFFGFKPFGLNKLLVPLLIGTQVIKSLLLAMFLPSIIGSFGKIVGKGLSQLSASSSQASFPPANPDDQDAYNNDNTMGFDQDPEPEASYAYQDQQPYGESSNINELADITMSRYGPGGAKVSYLPSKNSYYKHQAANTNYKVFHKIPASSMILSNYDPFYSPLLSRLDGIFARLGLAPAEGQALDQKIEACREQLICLMYASPAKYSPYSNLVSAQLSRELNELRRPVSDNPEILRFFSYMRAARRGQEGADCMRVYMSCGIAAAPADSMIAAYHDINKLVSARKLNN